MINVCTINSLLLFFCNATSRQSCSSSIFSKSKRLEIEIAKALYARKNMKTQIRRATTLECMRGKGGTVACGPNPSVPPKPRTPLKNLPFGDAPQTVSYGLVTSDETKVVGENWTCHESPERCPHQHSARAR